MPAPRLIDDYLAVIRRRLPADLADELADGLLETYDHHRVRGLAPEPAASAAITEFGTAEQVIASFAPMAPGRRTARHLLGAGSVVGACWTTGLTTAHAWTWQIPTPATTAFAALLTTTVAILATAHRTSYHHTRTAALLASLGVLTLDTVALAVIPTVAPTLTPLLQCALLASAIRCCYTVREVRGLLRTG